MEQLDPVGSEDSKTQLRLELVTLKYSRLHLRELFDDSLAISRLPCWYQIDTVNAILTDALLKSRGLTLHFLLVVSICKGRDDFVDLKDCVGHDDAFFEKIDFHQTFLRPIHQDLVSKDGNC